MVTVIGCATQPHHQGGSIGGAWLPPAPVSAADSGPDRILTIDRTMHGVAPAAGDHLLHALVYIGVGDHQEALSHYRMALETSRQLGNGAGELKALMNSGVVYHEIGQYTESLNYLARALELARAAGDAATEAKAIEYIDVVYGRLGHYIVAVSTAKAAQ
ncbi:MAG: tetratricopeptide repeat protein [Nitrospirota bacterium]